MAEEESFVILGSSPMPSLCSHADSLLYDGLDEEQSKAAETPDLKSIENEAELSSLTQLSVTPELAKSKESSLPTTLPETSLAASFIMGDLNADVLKNSVYSQFPSLCSMQACAEDVVKLQSMMSEHMALKQTLDKVNRTMRDYYKITHQWRQEAATRETRYQQQLQECQAQIEILNIENQKLKKDIELNSQHMQVAEDMHQKQHDELRQSLSEKSSLINNMRVEIDKLNQQELQSFEYIPGEDIPVKLDFIKRDEHEKEMKGLQRELSRLLAENLEINDMKKTYIDEINCFKVNAISAEELMNVMRADINLLKAKDIQNDDEITNLKAQIEIYRRDFEMERADREKYAGEKEQYLIDLRALQRRNQELIETLAEVHKSSKANSSASSTITSSNRTTLRDDQRPLRVLDPTGAAAKTADNAFSCPICCKTFTALTVLQSHVNDCLDKN